MGAIFADSSSKPINPLLAAPLKRFLCIVLAHESIVCANLSLFSDVLVVTVMNHGGVHPAGTTLKPPKQGLELNQLRLSACVALTAGKGQKGATNSRDRRIWCPNSENRRILAACRYCPGRLQRSHKTERNDWEA